MLTTSLLGRDLLRISDLSADEAIHLLEHLLHSLLLSFHCNALINRTSVAQWRYC